MKKIILCFVLVASTLFVKAQMYWYKEYDKVLAGGAITGLGGLARAGYEKGIGEGVFLAPIVFAEWGRPYQSTYSSYGLELGLGYAPFYLGRRAIFFLRGGGVAAYDKLTGLKDKISKLGFGVKGGVELEYFFSAQNDQTSISIFGNQSYYLKSAFDKTRYEVGIQLKFTIN